MARIFHPLLLVLARATQAELFDGLLDPELLFDSEITGSAGLELPIEVTPGLSVRSVTDSIAHRMALPGDVPWSLRDDGGASGVFLRVPAARKRRLDDVVAAGGLPFDSDRAVRLIDLAGKGQGRNAEQFGDLLRHDAGVAVG